MKKILLTVYCCCVVVLLSAQDFSNKGTDFWVTYPVHVDGTQSVMGIYITSDMNASGSITVGTQTIPFTVTPNNVTEKFIGNASCATCSASNGTVYLTQTDGIAIGAAIHVTANNPVVVYAHIIHSSRSGATLALPTPVWGKQYVVPSYSSKGNGLGEGNGTITIVAKDTNTTVQISPTARFSNSTRTQLTPYTITLANPGDVYQVQFEQDADISGTTVQSVSTGSGCKKIAVFSSTNWSAFGCSNASSGDNLYQQLFPTGAWGKSFLTAPAKTRTSDIIRVFVLDPTTVVTKTENGITTTLSGLINNAYYEYTTGNPTYIQASKAASVVQYFTTQSCQTNATIGDPEMVVINPVEQTINNITVFSAHKNWVPPGQSAITNCYLNIIIKTAAAASFKINGSAPAGSFIAIPGTGYSYLQEDVTNITISNPVQNLKADSNFIAIAYGFGQVESYGYNAGTNVIDLTQGMIIQNPYASSNAPATCTGTPFSFAVKFPYQPLSITWDFGNDPHLSPNAPVGPINNPVADSSFVDNSSGKTIYVYKLPGMYTYNTIGSYTVNVTSNNPTSDGCSGVQQQSYTVTVYTPPIASFGLVTSGCLSDSVRFTDSSNANGRTFIKWHWNFGDNTIDSVQNPVKKYTAAGNDTVQLRAINDIGCYADTTRPLALSANPVAKFGVSDTTCLNSILTFADSTSIASGTILDWYWDYGDGSRDTLTVAANRTHAYTQTGTDSVTLKLVSNTGCTVSYGKKLTISPYPSAGFVSPEVCLNDRMVHFADTSSIADGTQGQFSYSWSFTPADSAPVPTPTTATTKNPTVQFTAVGNYYITDTVTSNKGCRAYLSQPFTVNGSIPQAAFTIAGSTLCSNDSVYLINQSYVDFGSITKLEIYWDYANNPSQKLTDDTPVVNKTYAYLYDQFQQPATKTFQVRMLAYSGISCVSVKDTTITLTASPSVQFTAMPGICYTASPRQITQAIETGNVSGAFSYYGNGVNVNGLFNPLMAGVGTDTITALYLSTAGCRDSAKQTITVWPLPQAKWGAGYPTCVQNNITFTDTSVTSIGKIISWQWDFGDGTAQTYTSATPFTKQYAATGTDSVSLVVVTDSGCISMPSKQAIIIHPLPVVQFDLPAQVCLPGGKAQFTDRSTIADGSQALFAWSWSFGDANDPTPSTLQNPIHRYTAIASYNVQLVVTSKDGCVDSLTQTLSNILPQPHADFTIQPASAQVCMKDSVYFFDASNGVTSAIASWHWDLAEGNTASTQNTLRQFRDSGTYTISLYIYNMQGCVSDTATKQVTINPYPHLNLQHIVWVLQYGSVQLTPDYYAVNPTFNWTPATWLNDNAIADPVSTPLNDITYTLQVTGQGGCTVSDTTLVKVLLMPQIPNIFSPNGDGVNDTWQIQYLDSYPEATVEIYNRYGQQVYHAKGYSSGSAWDGRYNGQPLPVGTYYYIISPGNGRGKMPGSVTIIR